MTMTSKELNTFFSYLDLSENYLEFGCGDSTLYSVKRQNIKRIDSVESSEAYIDENLKIKPEVKNAITDGRLNFHIIDIGETEMWGNPINENKKHLWPNYSLSIFVQPCDYDLVLIDGRFRVSCALNTILNTSKNTIILFHDFWHRLEYHVILPFVNVVNRADSLAVFSKKEHLNMEKILSLIKKYQYLPKDITLKSRIKKKFLAK